ncbi:hypothetical protein Gohar_021850, partial [Gossypium harknessii]|nr:hypothetical protein [Gossypium harknessii]
FLYILSTGTKVSQCRERFQRFGATINRYFAIMLEKVSRMVIDLIAPGAIDDTHIVTILPPNEQIPDIGRKGVPTQNVMTMCDFNVFHIYYGWMGRTGT